MVKVTERRVALSTATSALAVVVLLMVGGSPRSLEASGCGDLGTLICTEYERCSGLWFWRKCTTVGVDYYPEQAITDPSG